MRSYIYRDCEHNLLWKALAAVKPEEKLITVIPGKYGEYDALDRSLSPGFRLIIETEACQHDWEYGFSMNAPTRTCKACGKVERN